MGPIEMNLPELGGLQPLRPEKAVSSAEQTQSFSSALEGAIHAVDSLQMTADVQANQVAMGGGNLHETALALEKADIGMRVMTKVRNKLIEAYQEVMRMSV